MLQRIDMVAIYVQDWTKALTWYEDSLGFTPVHVENDHEFAVLALPDGGALLHLVGDREREPGTRNRCAPNIAVDDFDATVAELRGRRVSVFDVTDDEDEGYRLARITDIEGNELNIYTM